MTNKRSDRGAAPRLTDDVAMRQEGRMSRVFAVVLAAAAVALAVAAPAAAQRKKITLDEMVIDGNIQKPEAFFILPRTNLNFADLERREDLKQRVVDSVEQQPF